MEMEFGLGKREEEAGRLWRHAAILKDRTIERAGSNNRPIASNRAHGGGLLALSILPVGGRDDIAFNNFTLIRRGQLLTKNLN